MILFYGYLDDAPLLRASGPRHAVHPTFSKWTAEDPFVLKTGDAGVDGYLRIAGAVVPLGDVDAVYARPLMPVATADAQGRERARVFDQTMLEWLDIADCRVVNPPSAMHSNASKPFQAQAIAAAGFLIPETLVTSDPGTARAFWRRHGSVVFKSTSGIRSIVRLLDEAYGANLERLRDLPTQFQEFVPGTDARACRRRGSSPFRVRSDASTTATRVATEWTSISTTSPPPPIPPARVALASPRAAILRHRPAPSAGWRTRMFRSEPQRL